MASSQRHGSVYGTHRVEMGVEEAAEVMEMPIGPPCCTYRVLAL